MFSVSVCLFLVESRTANKRGSQSTANGTHISYLSMGELALHSQLLMHRYREQRASHWSSKARVAQLKCLNVGCNLVHRKTLIEMMFSISVKTERLLTFQRFW